MEYDIDKIIQGTFELDDLYHYPDLRYSIVLLLNPTFEKIKTTRDQLAKTDLPWAVKHHIEIRLELLIDIISCP